MLITGRGARAVLTTALTIFVASSCTLRSSAHASSPATQPRSGTNAAANPDGPQDCKVIVQTPKVVNRSVTSYAYVKCGQIPDLYQFTAFLDLDGTPRDSCHQAFSWTYGEHCDLVADCKPGKWSVPFTLDVGLPGFDPSEKVDEGTTTAVITEADCGH